MEKGKKADNGDIEDIKEIKAKLEIALGEKAEYLDGWKRAKADSINEKKKFNQMMQMNLKLIIKQCVENVLPALDSFDSAFSDKSKWEKEVAEEWRKGMESIHAQLQKTLNDMNVKVIEVSAGDQFDPRLHEAVSTEKGEEDKVLKILSSGYMLEDFVIRPSRVIIGSENY